MAHTPQDVLDRIRELEREVRQLRGRAEMRPALNQILNGAVTIGEGGELIVRGAGMEEAMFRVGDLTTFYDELEFGTIIRRRDGSTALSIWNGQNATDPQVLRISDAQGHFLLVEDVTAGGLYKPWLPYPLPVRQDRANWPSTSSTSYETLARSFVRLQHPRMAVRVGSSSTGDATSQVRILVDGQTLVESTPGTALIATEVVPGYEYDAEVPVELQARVSSGTGTVRAAVESLYGIGSA